MLESTILIKTSKQFKNFQQKKHVDTFLNSGDYAFMRSLENDFINEFPNKQPKIFPENTSNELLTIQELYGYKFNSGTYLNKLLEESEIILPEIKSVERNPDLEKRCQMLRDFQNNITYNLMVQNVDLSRTTAEDSLMKQMKEMNQQLTSILNAILVIIAGFSFSFTGLEFFIGDLSTGAKICYGLMVAMAIAIAEFYFLIRGIHQSDRITESKKKIPNNQN